MPFIYKNILFCVTLIVSVFISTTYTQGVNSKCQLPNTGRRGICKLLTKCPSAIEDNNGSICSYHYNEPIVCCKDDSESGPVHNRFPGFQPWDSSFVFPDETNYYKKPSKAEQKCKEYTDLATVQVQAIALVPNPEPITAEVPKCDYNSLPLIVGGTTAEAGEFPHMALIGFRIGSKIEWHCGGTLISDRYVLTAGHCTAHTRIGKPVVIRLGELNLQSKNDGAQPQDIPIQSITIHPDYKIPEKYNDIALIRLVRPVQFNRFIRPACLWTKDRIDYNKTIATGWGNTEFGGHKSDELRKVALDIIDNSICNSLFTSHRYVPRGVIRSMMCAGNLEGGQDTCQGDSGGPIQVTSPINQCLFYVIGVTSFGKACALPNTPSIYTRVSEYVDWIENIVWP